MKHTLTESEKNIIRKMHRDNSIIKEQWVLDHERDRVYGDEDLVLAESTPTTLNIQQVGGQLLNSDGVYPFRTDTPEEVIRINIGVINGNAPLGERQLHEISKFKNLRILSIEGGTLSILPPQVIGPNLTFLNIPGQPHLRSLPVDAILNSNIGMCHLNVRNGTADSVGPEVMSQLEDAGINITK